MGFFQYNPVSEIQFCSRAHHMLNTSCELFARDSWLGGLNYQLTKGIQSKSIRVLGDPQHNLFSEFIQVPNSLGSLSEFVKKLKITQLSKSVLHPFLSTAYLLRQKKLVIF